MSSKFKLILPYRSLNLQGRGEYSFSNEMDVSLKLSRSAKNTAILYMRDY